jgi:hypothetical protein
VALERVCEQQPALLPLLTEQQHQLQQPSELPEHPVLLVLLHLALSPLHGLGRLVTRLVASLRRSFCGEEGRRYELAEFSEDLQALASKGRGQGVDQRGSIGGAAALLLG